MVEVNEQIVREVLYGVSLRSKEELQPGISQQREEVAGQPEEVEMQRQHVAKHKRADPYHRRLPVHHLLQCLCLVLRDA